MNGGWLCHGCNTEEPDPLRAVHTEPEAPTHSHTFDLRQNFLGVLHDPTVELKDEVTGLDAGDLGGRTHADQSHENALLGRLHR
jgi:hypothetical protein